VPDGHSAPDPELAPHPVALRVRFRRLLLTGLLILVPTAVTFWVLVRLFEVMDGIFAPVITQLADRYFPGLEIPGLGLMLTLLVILALGWLSTNIVGRRLIHWGERLIDKIPVASSIYAATKGLLQAFSPDQKEAFKRVVLIEYPKESCFALAFVTRSARWPQVHPDTADLVLVFVPTTPNPTSGFLLLLPRREVIDLPISVEEGIRMVISGGMLLPTLRTPSAAG